MTVSPLSTGGVGAVPYRSERPRAELWRRVVALLLFPVIIASLLVVVYEGLTLSSAVRAYVGGESLWSKGQKVAVQQLYRYALTRDEADYQRYVAALTVPMADRHARREMERPHPDVAAAAHWFVLGANHPADATNMVLLFLRFHRVSYIRRAIEIWTGGDREIDALDRIATELHGLVRAGAWDPVRRRDVLQRLAAVDGSLTALEADFSATLGEGARWMSRVIFVTAVLVGVLLIWIGMTVSNRLLEHARAAAELARRHEEEFRALVEHAPDVIARFDRQLRHTYVNPTATAVTGIPAADFVGKTHAELGFSTELAALWRDALQRVFETGEEGQLEFEFPGPTLGTNAARSFHVRLTPERAMDGRVASVLAIGRDTSELKASERALRESETQLRQAQKMEAIGRLAGGVAHDFNNLLTVIQASLDAALEDLPASAEFSVNLARDARRAAERAEMLTRQLLAFSRRQVVQPCVLRLDAAVADMQRLLTRLIGEDIRLMTAFDTTVPVVEADPGQIGQIILNLVINAREAMPSGGTLTIRTRVEAGGDGDAAPWAVLEVADTGVGMDGATQGRVFEPFFTTKEDGRGTGLGLSVVYGIVSQSGGRVEVESEMGKGTTFRVLLPACSAYCETAPPPSPALSLDGGNGTVLVVEDEDFVRALVREALRRQGYTVVEAPDGEAALRLVEAAGDPPGIDLLLSDVVMPVMGGRELVRELARRGYEIPVVFMSGYTNDPAPLEDMLGERAPFLPKPFTIERLGQVVRQALDAQVRRQGIFGAGTATISREA